MDIILIKQSQQGLLHPCLTYLEEGKKGFDPHFRKSQSNSIK